MPDLTPLDLARLLLIVFGLDGETTTNTDDGEYYATVQRLAAHGLLELDETDCYIVEVKITPAGKRVAEAMAEAGLIATAEENRPYVCPGCHAVAPDHCLPGCIDHEIEEERREAIESGDYPPMEDEDEDA